jgi:tRNA(fMet)-specific endonuclease VapC
VKYLLDTDHISIIQLRSGPEYVALGPRVAQRQSELAFSIISFHEQMLGAHSFIGRARGSSDVVRGYRLIGQIIEVFSTAPILPFDTVAAQVFDTLRAQRIRVPTMDLRIASIALSRRMVVVTRNISDFARVPGLITEDWTL